MTDAAKIARLEKENAILRNGHYGILEPVPGLYPANKVIILRDGQFVVHHLTDAQLKVGEERAEKHNTA